LAVLICTTSLLLLGQTFPLEPQAQSPSTEEWSAPIDLAASRQGKSLFPTIISDAAGGVHLFWDEIVTDEWGTEISSVDYAQWDGWTWSEPLDVFIGTGPGGTAWGAQAVVDSDGILHTVWIDNLSLKYAQRHVSSPVSARSWTGETVLATSEARIGPAAIALDDFGILHVLYLDAGLEQAGIYYLRSESRGEIWETPVPISEPSPEWSRAIQRYLFDLLPVGDTLHAVWVVSDSNKMYYAQGQARGKLWSAPRLLHEDGEWPDLVALDDGRLLLVATGALPGDSNICYKLQFTSRDGGANWDARHILMPYVRGCLGVINVRRAGDGSYHLITSAYRSEELDLNGIYYSVLQREEWRAPQRIPSMDSQSLGTQIDFPRAVVSEGNLLHIVFHVDEGRIWYVRRSLPAPHVPLIRYPMPEAKGQGDAQTGPTPVARPTGEPGQTAQDTISGMSRTAPTPAVVTPSPQQLSTFPGWTQIAGTTMFPIAASVAVSTILVGITLLWKVSRRRR
jgi:hypothetical protein